MVFAPGFGRRTGSRRRVAEAALRAAACEAAGGGSLINLHTDRCRDGLAVRRCRCEVPFRRCHESRGGEWFSVPSTTRARRTVPSAPTVTVSKTSWSPSPFAGYAARRGKSGVGGTITGGGGSVRGTLGLCLGPGQRRQRAERYRYADKVAREAEGHGVGRVTGPRAATRGASDSQLTRTRVARGGGHRSLEPMVPALGQ